MTQGFEPGPADAQSPAVAYEQRDIAWRKVLTLLAITTVVLVALHIVTTVMFSAMVGSTKYTTEPFGEPAAPMVQQLQDLRRHEEQTLTGYGWVSRDERIVRIPVERAMDLIIAEYREKQP